MNPARHQPGKVRHIDQVERANLIRNLPHADKINDAWIGAPPANDQLRPFLLRKLFQFVVVDRLRFLGDAVRNNLVSLAREIQMMPVRQMSAMSQVQPKNRVARLQHRRISLHVRLRSRMRLHIGMLGAEELLRPVASQVLDYVRELAPAVITLARISLSIFVREHRARRL